MVNTGKPMGLIVAIMDFFGRKPGQNLSEFQAEVKALSDADRAYFKTHLEAAGYIIA